MTAEVIAWQTNETYVRFSDILLNNWNSFEPVGLCATLYLRL